MPINKRCRYYSDDGSPVKGGCRYLATCNFIHPSEPGWETAIKSEPFRKDHGSRGGFGGSTIPRKRSYGSTAREDNAWDNSHTTGTAEVSPMTGDGGWKGMARGQGGNVSSSSWEPATGASDNRPTTGWSASGDAGGQSSGGGWGQSTGGGWGQSTGGGWGDSVGGGWGNAGGGGGGGGGGGSEWGKGWGTPGDTTVSGGDAPEQQQTGWGNASNDTSSGGWGAPPPPPAPTTPSHPPPSNDMPWSGTNKAPSPAPSMSAPSTPMLTSAFSDRQSSRQPSETPSSMLRGSTHDPPLIPENIKGRHDSWLNVIKKFVRAVNTQRKINEAEDNYQRMKNLQNSKEYERVCPGGQVKLDSLRAVRKEALQRAETDLHTEVISLCTVPDASAFLSGLDPEPHNNEARRYLDEVNAWILNMEPAIKQLVTQEEAAFAQKEEDGEPLILPPGTEDLFHRMKALENVVQDIGEQNSQATSDALEALLRTKVEEKHDDIVSRMRQAQGAAMDELLQEPIGQLQQKEEALHRKLLGLVEQVSGIYPRLKQAEDRSAVAASSAKHYEAMVQRMSAIESKQIECDRQLEELKVTKARFEQAFLSTPPAAEYPSREVIVSALAPSVRDIVRNELQTVLEKNIEGTEKMIELAEETQIAKIWYPIQDVALLGKWLEMSSSRAAGIPFS